MKFDIRKWLESGEEVLFDPRGDPVRLEVFSGGWVA